MEAQFEYVYVNQDGTIREVSPNERKYLSEEFSPCDGGRPYIKGSYDALDGWGSKSGFMPRSMIPSNLEVQPVNPGYDAAAPSGTNVLADILADHQRAGNAVTRNADGSVTVTLNRGPKKTAGLASFFKGLFGWDASTSKANVAGQGSFESLRRMQLEHQAQRENFARHPDHR